MSLFITDQGFEFLNHINSTLLDNVVQNSVVLYKLSLNNSGRISGKRGENLYGETIVKDYQAGTTLSALIEPEDQITSDDTGLGPDVGWRVRFGFHRKSLDDISVYPELGDTLDWNDAYFEIDAVVENTLMGGIPDYKIGIVCDTHMTRRSRLQIERLYRGS